MENENKYHFAREIIFNLRSCHAITEQVYLHWINKLIKEENEVLPQENVSGRSEQFNCGKERVFGEKKCDKQCNDCLKEYGSN